MSLVRMPSATMRAALSTTTPGAVGWARLSRTVRNPWGSLASAVTVSTLTPAPRSWSARSARLCLRRATRVTTKPSRAKRRAIAAPGPGPAPRTRLPADRHHQRRHRGHQPDRENRGTHRLRLPQPRQPTPPGTVRLHPAPPPGHHLLRVNSPSRSKSGLTAGRRTGRTRSQNRIQHPVAPAGLWVARRGWRGARGASPARLYLLLPVAIFEVAFAMIARR